MLHVDTFWSSAQLYPTTWDLSLLPSIEAWLGWLPFWRSGLLLWPFWWWMGAIFKACLAWTKFKPSWLLDRYICGDLGPWALTDKSSYWGTASCWVWLFQDYPRCPCRRDILMVLRVSNHEPDEARDLSSCQEPSHIDSTSPVCSGTRRRSITNHGRSCKYWKSPAVFDGIQWWVTGFFMGSGSPYLPFPWPFRLWPSSLDRDVLEFQGVHLGVQRHDLHPLTQLGRLGRCRPAP